MNELINIQEQEGKQLVSAKELYTGLEMNKAAWSRWSKSNIEENEYFKEENEWIRVQHYVEGNLTNDYMIILEFAKHISMMARTEKSHKYRGYFIKVEQAFKEQVLNQVPKLSMEDMMILQLEEQKNIKNRVDTLEDKIDNQITIDHGKQRIVQKEIGKRIFDRLQENPIHSLYSREVKYGLKKEIKDKIKNSIKRKYFSALHREIKNRFAVTSYKDIKIKDFDSAINYIKNWIENQELRDYSE